MTDPATIESEVDVAAGQTESEVEAQVEADEVEPEAEAKPTPKAKKSAPKAKKPSAAAKKKAGKAIEKHNAQVAEVEESIAVDERRAAVRYRPHRLDEVVGQQVLVRTLTNGFRRGSLRPVFLLVGPKGTGKTTTARLIASGLNCTDESVIGPCGVCESCVAIRREHSVNVQEIDAATNNTVDDVRELRERVGVTAFGGGVKVYILDEVHMLTPQAWNALLKMLEEPPPKTTFVLATTESGKIPQTIIDRAMRFDLERPNSDELVVALRRFVEGDGLEVADDAIALIARSADGSYRRALGALEKVVDYADGPVSAQDAATCLGRVGDVAIDELVEHVIARRGGAAVLKVGEILSNSVSAEVVLRELEQRASLMIRLSVIGSVPEEIARTIGDERGAVVLGQALRLTSERSMRLLDAVARALGAIRNGSDAQAHLEAAVVRSALGDLGDQVLRRGVL